MSWLSDIGDWVGSSAGSESSWGSDAGDWFTKNFGNSSDAGTTGGGPSGVFGDSWLGRNWDTIGNVANTGRGVYNLFSSNNARKGVRSDVLGVYERMMAQDQEYRDQMAQFQAQQSGAAAAARRQNDAARMVAAGKALKVQKKHLKALQKQYEPYADAAKMLTPKMADNYKQYLDTTALLNQYLSPSVMRSLTETQKPAWAQEIPQSAYSVPVVQSEPVSFPTMAELLKGGR